MGYIYAVTITAMAMENQRLSHSAVFWINTRVAITKDEEIREELECHTVLVNLTTVLDYPAQ